MVFSWVFLVLAAGLLRTQGAGNISLGGVVLIAAMAVAITDLLNGGDFGPVGTSLIHVIQKFT